MMIIFVFFCTVFGWFSDSLTEVEDEISTTLPVGYQKGAAQAALGLVFNITDQPGTARMYCDDIVKIYCFAMFNSWNLRK